jgi:hypothetical protein
MYTPNTLNPSLFSSSADTAESTPPETATATTLPRWLLLLLLLFLQSGMLPELIASAEMLCMSSRTYSLLLLLLLWLRLMLAP